MLEQDIGIRIKPSDLDDLTRDVEEDCEEEAELGERAGGMEGDVRVVGQERSVIGNLLFGEGRILRFCRAVTKR